MLFIMSIAVLIRMPEAYAVNVTVKTNLMSTTSYHVVLPTANVVSLLKGNKPIAIAENENVASVDAEDYLEEDSDEDYDDMKKENASGEFTYRSRGRQSCNNTIAI